MFVTYAELREPVATAPDAVALLPLGAMETHGPHLPLGTDSVIAEGIIDRAATLFDGSATVLRLPLLWLGASAEHAHRAGTLSQEPEALIAQIVALTEGLHHAGLRRIVLFNAHGGNVAALTIAALKLRNRFEMLAASAHWLDFGLPKEITPPTPVREDVHGGWVETSVMLHLAPHLVQMTEARPQPARPPAPLLSPSGPIRWGWQSDDLGGGWIGRPELADAKMGQAMVDHAARGLNELLSTLAVAPWRAP
jgi:creatinine amidohydrolase